MRTTRNRQRCCLWLSSEMRRKQKPEVSRKTSLPCSLVYDKMRLGTTVYICKPVDERNDRRDINPEDFINAG